MKIVPQYDKLTNQLLIDTRFSKKPTNIPEAVVNPGRKLYKHNQLQSLEIHVEYVMNITSPRKNSRVKFHILKEGPCAETSQGSD